MRFGCAYGVIFLNPAGKHSPHRDSFEDRKKGPQKEDRKKRTAKKDRKKRTAKKGPQKEDRKKGPQKKRPRTAAGELWDLSRRPNVLPWGQVVLTVIELAIYVTDHWSLVTCLRRSVRECGLTLVTSCSERCQRASARAAARGAPTCRGRRSTAGPAPAIDLT